MKWLVRRLLPASFRRSLRLRLGWRWFHGDYRTWEEAQSVAGGYDEAAILERVLHATREVRAGRALWERDGTLFLQPAVNEPLLKALLAARPPGRRLEVIDFGGALGSVWWQHRMHLGEVGWRVVEQPHYVAAGRELAGGTLSFHASISDALASGPADVLLFSGVLQYLPEPHLLLAEAGGTGVPHLIIDRTSLLTSDRRSRLVVQRTPPALGGGSYPCWLFNRAELIGPLAACYELCAEWPALDELAHDVHHTGFHFCRRK